MKANEAKETQRSWEIKCTIEPGHFYPALFFTECKFGSQDFRTIAKEENCYHLLFLTVKDALLLADMKH